MTHTDYRHKPDDYQIFTVIGKGCDDQAEICLARHIPSNTAIAIKRIPLDHCVIDITRIQHEVLMMRMMMHQHLLPLFNSFVCDNQLWVLTPLKGYGSCRDLLQAHFGLGLPEQAIAFLLRDVLAALDYLHVKGFIHRAVRASHILISATGHVCLSGMRHSCSMLSTGKRARAIHDFPDHYIRSLLWASPELLEQNLGGYDTKTDIYSIGITACELANGVVPFSDVPATQMLLEKLDGSMPRLLDSVTFPELQLFDPSSSNTDSGQENHSLQDNGDVRAPYQRTFSSHFHHFVELCLQPDPAERPSAAALLQHSFFRQLRKKPSTEALPDLLRPVSPIRDVSGFKEACPDVDNVTQDLEDITMDATQWDF